MVNYWTGVTVVVGLQFNDCCALKVLDKRDPRCELMLPSFSTLIFLLQMRSDEIDRRRQCTLADYNVKAMEDIKDPT